MLDDSGPEPPPPPKRLEDEASQTSRDAPVKLRVVWGDLCRVEADVHCVGHYEGVMPTSAEAALDKAISGPDTPRRIIAEHTRRRWFLGQFGHVNYFPSAHDVVNLAAVAGMGRPGNFTEARCTRLAENLLLELCAAGSATAVATVAIGSGAGNLSIDQAARALANGFADALKSSRMQHPCTQIDIVEYDRLRAQRLLAGFRAAVPGLEAVLELKPALEPGAGGGVSPASASVYALGAVARCAAAGGGSLDRMQTVLEELEGSTLASLVVGELKKMDPDDPVRAFEVSMEPKGERDDRPPVRISILDEGNGASMRIAAITGTATVPERQIDADPDLIDEIVRRMNPPDESELDRMAALMSRMVLPGDLQALVSADAPLVFEVDRRTAQIHWELVVDLARPSWTSAANDPVDSEGRSTATTDAIGTPLLLRTSVSRQLRTAYSRPPVVDVQTARELKVLIIGDPGGEGSTLPGARREAEAVRAKLKELGITVKALIGAPSLTGVTRTRPVATPATEPVVDQSDAWTPAGRLDVLDALLSGEFQVVHYCGHGTFDPKDQRRAGWVFDNGLLTSRELAQLTTPPRLVVANACFTSKLGVAADGGRTRVAPGAIGESRRSTTESKATGSDSDTTVSDAATLEARLTPSLADEFFRCGISNYIGAAWKVSDVDAVLFSTTFYEQIFGPARATLGAALTAARNAVWTARVKARRGVGTTWAAYQHYGDPSDRLSQGVANRGP